MKPSQQDLQYLAAYLDHRGTISLKNGRPFVSVSHTSGPLDIHRVRRIMNARCVERVGRSGRKQRETRVSLNGYSAYVLLESLWPFFSTRKSLDKARAVLDAAKAHYEKPVFKSAPTTHDDPLFD